MSERIEVGRIPQSASKIKGMLRFVSVEGDDLVVYGKKLERMSPEERERRDNERKAKLKELRDEKAKQRQKMRDEKAKQRQKVFEAKKDLKNEFDRAKKNAELPNKRILEIYKEEKELYDKVCKEEKELYDKIKNMKSVEEIRQVVNS